VGYDGRTAGSAEKGYLHFFKYIKHHSKLSIINRQLNYKNHFFMYLKNSKWIHPSFILREIAMLGYILILETSTLKVLPEMSKLWAKMIRKRKYILGK
jgi:hypothetical protein